MFDSEQFFFCNDEDVDTDPCKFQTLKDINRWTFRKIKEIHGKCSQISRETFRTILFIYCCVYRWYVWLCVSHHKCVWNEKFASSIFGQRIFLFGRIPQKKTIITENKWKKNQTNKNVSFMFIHFSFNILRMDPLAITFYWSSSLINFLLNFAFSSLLLLLYFINLFAADLSFGFCFVLFHFFGMPCIFHRRLSKKEKYIRRFCPWIYGFKMRITFGNFSPDLSVLCCFFHE